MELTTISITALLMIVIFFAVVNYTLQAVIRRDDELLEDYSRERGFSESERYTFTLKDLIKSHRNLINELNSGLRKEVQEERQRAVDFSVAQAVAEVKEEGWISKERLKEMSFQEIANWIGTDEHYD